MGPLVTRAHRDKVSSYIDSGVAEGAELVVDGRGLKLQGYENGFWLGGTLLDRVTPAMSVYRDEIFGPVLSVVRAGAYEDAVGLINANPFANGTALFTRDGDAARDFADRIAGGHGGDQCADPGAGGLSQLRRLEILDLRLAWRLWPRGGTLLYTAEDGDVALAGRHPLRRAVPLHGTLSNTLRTEKRLNLMRPVLALALRVDRRGVCSGAADCGLPLWPDLPEKHAFRALSRDQPGPGLEQYPDPAVAQQPAAATAAGIGLCACRHSAARAAAWHEAVILLRNGAQFLN